MWIKGSVMLYEFHHAFQPEYLSIILGLTTDHVMVTGPVLCALKRTGFFYNERHSYNERLSIQGICSLPFCLDR